MLGASRARILELLGDDDLVLDVGGGASPFERADWVIDLLAYEQRGLYGPAPDPARERFAASTWVQRDVCDRDPWPFADRQFDFSVCSHTLEDVRDPMWVCSELIRVSRAGYIEVPSRLEEQSYGFQGPWVGWGHHRWLIESSDDELTFVFKHHVMHGRSSDHFPAGFRDALAMEQRVLCFWWTGGFRYRERVFLDAPSLDSYLAEFVSRHDRPRGGTLLRRLRGRVNE
ncbi:MAG: methionine biosynthesis protein MetW [Solirubrobacteraceae bacterium]